MTNSTLRYTTGLLLTLAAVVVFGMSWGGYRSVSALNRTNTLGPAVETAISSSYSMERCIDCHADIVTRFQTAPHARTLISASNPEILKRFAGQAFIRADTKIEYRYSEKDGRLYVKSEAYGRELPIDWMFGSGTHAQTPLITWEDEQGKTTSIEHSVSWYPEEGLDVTLGLETLTDTHGLLAMGNPHPPDETINCFGCHATHVSTENQTIDFNHLIPNVSCNRCHWDSDTHAEAMNEGQIGTIEILSQLSPQEAVDRCGECHRRADEMGGSIEPNNPTLARFASVGLIQSPCFQKQADVVLESGKTARLDCATCHDPHQPTVRDWRYHVKNCRNCHDGNENRAVHCSIASPDDNCLTCHMPAVPANQKLSFTDHWIRVRDLP